MGSGFGTKGTKAPTGTKGTKAPAVSGSKGKGTKAPAMAGTKGKAGTKALGMKGTKSPSAGTKEGKGFKGKGAVPNSSRNGLIKASFVSSDNDGNVKNEVVVQMLSDNALLGTGVASSATRKSAFVLSLVTVVGFTILSSF